MVVPRTAVGRRSPRGVFHQLEVIAKEALCDDAAAITFDVPPPLADEFAFAAGQSVTLRRTVDGVEHRRSYSICAPAGDRLRVGVRRIPNGLFSGWLIDAVEIGDRVDVQPPRGSFVADQHAGGRHLLIAAGSGITPILSIVGTVLRDPAATATLIYANRRVSSVMFTEEIADLKNSHPDRFEVIHVLSREPRDVELFSGRLDADRLRAILAELVPLDRIDDVWLCGPFDLITTARRVVTEMSIGGPRIHNELFFVEDAAPTPAAHPERDIQGPAAELSLTLCGSTSTTKIAHDETVLEAASRVRSDVPFACKGGVCGTCRALITAGDGRMRRNYALEDDEIAAGFVLTCQTYPAGDMIAVDYDT